jgi:hypothetical protein
LELFKLFGTLALLGVDEANKDIEETTKNAGGLGDKLKSGITTATKWGAGIAAGATAAAAGVMKVAMDSAAAADEVDKMSQKIGISKQGYQEWSYVLGQNGMDISSLQMGMKTLVTQMDGVVNGTDSSIAMFDALGLSVYDSTGALKDQETMMNEVMVALADMPNGTEKARLATELFGRSGSELMPMLNQGSSAMMDLTQRAHDLGLVMSDESVTAGVVLGDTMDDVKKSLGMVATELGVQLMPIVQMALEWVIENLPVIKEYVTEAMDTIGVAIEAIKPIVQILFKQIGVLWETVLKPVLSGIITFLTGTFTGDWGKAWEGVESVLKGILNGIIGGIEWMVNKAIDGINALIDGINDLAVVEAIAKIFGVDGIPKLQNITLPRLEQGGILAKGQIGLLEGSGAEAVVPLDQNQAWISAVARDMESAVGGGATQVLERILDVLQTMDDNMTEKMQDAFASMKFDINNREFARMVKVV